MHVKDKEKIKEKIKKLSDIKKDMTAIDKELNRLVEKELDYLVTKAEETTDGGGQEVLINLMLKMNEHFGPVFNEISPVN